MEASGHYSRLGVAGAEDPAMLPLPTRRLSSAPSHKGHKRYEARACVWCRFRNRPEASLVSQ